MLIPPHEHPGSVDDVPYLLWNDCEFTGLDTTKGDRIIEIGGLVTTLALQEVESYESFVRYDWDETYRLMMANPRWEDRGPDIERMRQGVPNGLPRETIDVDLSDMVTTYFGNIKPPLCGNSVHSDKRQIDQQFPLFAATLSYQIIDVTSLKLLAQKYRGIRYEGKLNKHYALDDIRESVDELRWLLGKLGIADVARIPASHPVL